MKAAAQQVTEHDAVTDASVRAGRTNCAVEAAAMDRHPKARIKTETTISHGRLTEKNTTEGAAMKPATPKTELSPSTQPEK
jgi:hypothetical protein